MLRNIFIWGTALFFIALIVLTVHTLSEVNATRTPGLTQEVVEGRKVWQHKNCNDCHTILGIGGYWAPDLTKEADVRDAQFLTAFLKDPQAAKPGTTRPAIPMTAEERNAIVEYLMSLK